MARVRASLGDSPRVETCAAALEVRAGILGAATQVPGPEVDDLLESALTREPVVVFLQRREVVRGVLRAFLQIGQRDLPRVRPLADETRQRAAASGSSMSFALAARFERSRSTNPGST